MSECKHPGCGEPAVTRKGVYAGLCTFHREQRKHDRAKRVPNGSHVDDAERFLAAARALDEAELEVREALKQASR